MKAKFVISSMLSIGIMAAVLPSTLLAEEIDGVVISDETPSVETLMTTRSTVSASASSVQLIPASSTSVGSIH
ncbi:MAG: hypothetical protein D3903_20750 [Candidatus Electrothrix sp. GM3_4]|nr:hypothetical protein [Candidatus Electrothrix sp. GM3_4]